MIWEIIRYSNPLMDRCEKYCEFIQRMNLESSMLGNSFTKKTLSKFKRKSGIKICCIRLMKLLDLTESQLVSAYCQDIDANESSSLERFERLSYIARNFDIPTLKKIGIIKSRAKIDEYEQCICSFFGFSSIYEYDDTSLMPTLFSKSKKRVLQEKETKDFFFA